MSEQQLSMLVPASARMAQTDLLEALGTENNAAQWMTFMDTVTRLLPEVLAVGRPSKDLIARCFIGQLGFSSWQAMIEAPTDAGGLGWNFSAWKAWRRAWSVVQAYPWLRHSGFSSSRVNNMSNNYRRWGYPFPESAEAFQQLQDEADQKREVSDKARIAELQAELNQERRTVRDLRAENQRLELNLGELKALCDSATNQVHRLQQQLQDALAKPSEVHLAKRRGLTVLLFWVLPMVLCAVVAFFVGVNETHSDWLLWIDGTLLPALEQQQPLEPRELLDMLP